MNVDMLQKAFQTFWKFFADLSSSIRIYETVSRFVSKPLSFIARHQAMAPPKNSINGLPPEILVYIFSMYIKSEGYRKFLENVPLVCKRWNHICSTPALWRDVTSTVHGWTWNELKKLGENGLLSSARHLELTDVGGHNYNDDELTQLIRYCHNLRELKVEKVALNTAVLIEVLTEECPNIESLDFRTPNDGTPFAPVGPLLNVRGHNIKKLALDNYFFLVDPDLISTIAINCHSLEELLFHEKVFGPPRFQIPLDELMLGCPKLRRLAINHCDVIGSEVEDRKGFKNMVSFRALEIDFGGLSLHSMLQNSINLEVLNLSYCLNVPLNNMSKIRSNKVEDLQITGFEGDPAKSIAEAVGKWRLTLKVIRLDHSDCDLTCIFEVYLRDNPDPKLEKLYLLLSQVSRPVLKTVMRASLNLHHVGCMSYVGADTVAFLTTREQVENFCAD